MKSYLIKNKKYTFMIIFFICFFFCIGKVDALIYKDSVYGSYTIVNNQNGQLSVNQSTKIEYHFNNPNFNLDYDILGLKFGTLNIKTTDNITLTGNVGVNGIYCTNFTENTSTHTFYCSSGTYTGNSGTLTTSNALNDSILYLSANLHYIKDNVDYYLPCTLETETEYQWFCPFNKSYGQPYSFDFEIKNGGFDNLTYNVGLNGWKYYYNHDSTEIITALSQLGTIQQTTTTTIQNFNNYVSDNNTTQAQTNQNTALGGMNSEFSSHLSQMNELTQLTMLPLTFINSLLTNTCQPLVWDIPFVNSRVVVPCMSTIYNGYFSALVSTFSLIMTALLGYRAFIKLFNAIKGIIDAEDDKLEVVDL